MQVFTGIGSPLREENILIFLSRRWSNAKPELFVILVNPIFYHQTIIYGIRAF